MFKCSTCDRMLQSRDSVRRHKRAIHTGKKDSFKCHLCHYTCNKACSLKQHNKVHTGEDKGRFPCQLCPKAYRSKQGLEYHTRTHTGEKPYPCELCPLEAYSAYNLTRHMKKHKHSKVQDFIQNPPQASSFFVCTKCKASFLEKAQLQKHVVDQHFHEFELLTNKEKTQIREKEKSGKKYKFKCKFCPDRFERKEQLENHFTIHTGEKSYSCSEPNCTYTARTSTTLRSHIERKHKAGADQQRAKSSRAQYRLTRVKKHACPLCSYKAKELFKLKYHIKTHTGEKPFSCSVCPYAAITPDKVKRHMQTHTRNKTASL